MFLDILLQDGPSIDTAGGNCNSLLLVNHLDGECCRVQLAFSSLGITQHADASGWLQGQVRLLAYTNTVFTHNLGMVGVLKDSGVYNVQQVTFRRSSARSSSRRPMRRSQPQRRS